ncbi:uncharacterized protein DUF1360 [Cytobacillus horneckiae]|uniref:DUF1360 domain-containing protein n=2 Tax=Cytobacillus horneckiae TaxID=549687 RepID=UPI0039A092CC
MMDISSLEFILIGLATFRLTRLIVFDQITEWMRAPFMKEIDEENENGEMSTYIVPKEGGIFGFFGKLLSCYWCTGVWSSIILCVLYFWWHPYGSYLIILLAVASLAAIIEAIMQKWIID